MSSELTHWHVWITFIFFDLSERLSPSLHVQPVIPERAFVTPYTAYVILKLSVFSSV